MDSIIQGDSKEYEKKVEYWKMPTFKGGVLRERENKRERIKG